MILLTGGAGLIGSAILWKLNELGRSDVVVVDHLATGEKWQNLRALQFQDYFEKDEFRELLLAGKFEGKFDEILHLGACSDTTQIDASYLAGNNFAYGKLLAEYTVRNGARMVYASSAATYGDGENGFDDNEDTIFQLRPLNKYGYSKQIFDEWLKLRGWMGTRLDSGASFVGVKYSNVFGPNEYHKANMRSMVLRSFEQITAGGKVALFKSYRPEYADGEQVRDFLYVKDAADMTLFFLGDGAGVAGLFNIGYGSVRSWNDLARAAFAALGRPVHIEYIEMPETLKSRYQYYTCLNMEKLRKAGYTRHLTNLEDAVKDYASYFVRNGHLGD
ncbi:MAG: ADP-glyceromanno-heptose 6-epimerase [Victivallales bacterium]|nr:ADP-glyceromanno-heptose 6-epimerase [Victivallales bacterium]